MKWEARTSSLSLGPNTRLFVYASPQSFGEKPYLQGDHDLWIEVSNRWVKAQVLGASRSTALLVLPNGISHTITPLQKGEHGSGISLGGHMYGEDWVIRAP